MFARVSRLRIQPDRIDLGIRLVQERLVPAFGMRDGATFGSWMADRDSGEVVAVTCFETVPELDAWMADTSQLRAGVVDEVGGLTLGSEVHQIVGMEEVAAIDADTRIHTRIIWADGISGDVLATAKVLFEETMEEHRTKPAFLNAMWAANPSASSGLALTAWTGAEAIVSDEPGSRRRRKQVSKQLGLTISATRTYEAVATSIATPTTVDVRDGFVEPVLTA